MKNFFLTILLVLITIFGLSAQTPLNLNGFTHTVTPGQCRADAKIKVTLPPTIGAAGTKLQVKLDKPNGTSVTERLAKTLTSLRYLPLGCTLLHL